MAHWLFLALGGVLGTFARYGLGSHVQRVTPQGFPYGTLAVNVTGCFLIGLFASVAGGQWMKDPALKLFLVTGFCGAYTTFSAYILESGELLSAGYFFPALLNVLLGTFLGFTAYWLGLKTASFF